MDCPHLLDNIKLESDFIKDKTITKNLECAECAVKEQNWLCLQCGIVNCGRYSNGHALQHVESAKHQICMSCDDFSVYCYQCDEYISNDTDEQTIDKVRQTVKKIRNDYDDFDISREPLENSKDGSEDQNSSTISAPSLQGDSSQRSLHSDGSRDENRDENLDEPASTYDSSNNLYENPSPETSETKTTKTTANSDEPARSLRSRSRKRSHSDDSSATDNSTQTSGRSSKERKPNGKTQRERKILGLKNLGNTCFMNAVLQSLNNIQEFSCYFSQLPCLEIKTNGRKVYHSRSITRQEMHDVVMAEELRKVLINLNAGGCGTKGAISPECLFLVIWKVVPRFRGYQQQDAHEFLRYMLDRLHTELLQLLPARAEGLPRTPSASIVTAVFGGTLQSEVRCLACGTESKKFDPFLDLSLELPDAGRHDGPVALADCLASFVQVEVLADTERYYCNSCKCKQKSTKQFRIRRLPNVLCLHLKRFRWHNYFRTKVDTGISFPLKALDMSRFVLSNVPDTRRSGLGNNLYDLAAVIVHHGSGAGSGHYTAFAINEAQWFHFNDQTVRAADADAVAACKPYILFYIRRELAIVAS